MYFVIYLFGIIIIITTDTTLDNCQVNKKKITCYKYDFVALLLLLL